jgi:hypothetical protein
MFLVLFDPLEICSNAAFSFFSTILPYNPKHCFVLHQPILAAISFVLNQPTNERKCFALVDLIVSMMELTPH